MRHGETEGLQVALPYELYPDGDEVSLADIFLRWKQGLCLVERDLEADEIRSGENSQQTEVIQKGDAGDLNRMSGGAGEEQRFGSEVLEPITLVVGWRR